MLKLRYVEHPNPSVAFLGIHRRDAYCMMSRARKNKMRSSEDISTDKYTQTGRWQCVLVLFHSSHVMWAASGGGAGARRGSVVTWGGGSLESGTEALGFSLQSSWSTFTPLWNITRSGICFKVIQGGWESRWRSRRNKIGHELITVHIGL